MHWQEAVEQSPEGMAVRTVGDVTYVRDIDGDTMRVGFGVHRRAERREADGYTDWQPKITKP